MNKYPNLFSPIKISSHTYKNRIICSPMGFGFLALGGKENADRLYRISEEKAKGGAAEVIIGETPVNCEDAPNAYFPGIEVDYKQKGGYGFEVYKGYADAIKKHGAIALIEIFHAGHDKSPLPFGKRINPWGPMAFFRSDGVTVESFDAEKIEKVRADFVTCSEFMKAAGFDGVCIHGGHGFLLTQFLSSVTNQRKDKYGGSLENRGRFPREIISGIRNRLGPDFIIELRINGVNLVEGGTTNEETAEFCRTLEGLVDIVHISNGRIYQTSGMSSHYHEHGVNVELAANIKKKIKIPVAVVGGINSPELAERIIAEGKADMIVLGRQFIADPEFSMKTMTDREEEIRRCIRCYHCYPGQPDIPGDKGMVLDMTSPDTMRKLKGWKCTINPIAGNEIEIETMPEPGGSRKVLVVGGGPGGMQAAITACDRGHEVTLIERNSILGGTLFFTDYDAFKVDLKNFKDLLVREVVRRNINVMLGITATPEMLGKIKPDVVILALGASPTMHPIPGIQTAIHALDAYKDEVKIGKQVVMIGGGLAGCETALHLAEKGHHIILIEMLNRLAPESTGFALTATIREIEKRTNIIIKTGAKCVEINLGSVKVKSDSGNEEVIKCDTVIYSLGMSARRNEVELLRHAAGKATVFEVGDCVRGARVYEATSEGFLAAMKIL